MNELVTINASGRCFCSESSEIVPIWGKLALSKHYLTCDSPTSPSPLAKLVFNTNIEVRNNTVRKLMRVPNLFTDCEFPSSMYLTWIHFLWNLGV